MQLIESVAVRLDQAPWAPLWRFVLGWSIVAAWIGATRDARRTAAFIVFFLGVLFAVRLVPAVLRKLLPFSASAQAIWAERRRFAKRFDSYQWQKLFWIGLGCTVYLSVSAGAAGGLWPVAILCLASGASGLMTWRFRKAQIAAVAAPTAGK